jgi:hypothetical protein
LTNIPSAAVRSSGSGNGGTPQTPRTKTWKQPSGSDDRRSPRRASTARARSPPRRSPLNLQGGGNLDRVQAAHGGDLVRVEAPLVKVEDETASAEGLS